MGELIKDVSIACAPLGPFQTNCYLLFVEDSSGDKRCAIIDPGLGALAAIQEEIAAQDAEVTDVFLTHGHIDHTRGAAEVAQFYNVAVSIHPDDAFMLTKPAAGVSAQIAVLFDAASMEMPPQIVHVVDGQRISLAGVEFLIRHAPGHSPGCILAVGEDLVFSGDVLFKGSIGRTDLPYSDPEAMEHSLETVVKNLPTDLPVLPGHGPATSVIAELRSNPFLGAR